MATKRTWLRPGTAAFDRWFRESCVCAETSTRNCPEHQNGDRSFLRRIWDRVRYADRLLLDGFRTFRLWR
jgi:hypothetical protein